MTKIKPQNELGITLIALIITIIILIILAAVSIVHMLNLQIIGQAVNGTQDYSVAQDKEKNEMENIANTLESALATQENPQTPTPELPPITLTADSDIGKYVDYIPTSGSYTASNSYSGYSSNQTFYTEIDMKWRVWNVDSNNLYLISDRPTNSGGYNSSGQLYLSNALGYNNGVTLLDNLCSNCYKNSSYSGMTARSLKISDIEDVTTYDYTSFENYNASPYTYSSASSPYVWGQYESADVANRSTAYNLTAQSYNSEQTFTPRGSFWAHQYSSGNADTEWSNTKYYELICSPTNNTSYYPNYWLSSRYVDLSSSSSCDFGLQDVRSGNVGGYELYVSIGFAGNDRYRTVRPIVTIPINSCTITDSTDSNYDYHIAPKA